MTFLKISSFNLTKCLLQQAYAEILAEFTEFLGSWFDELLAALIKLFFPSVYHHLLYSMEAYRTMITAPKSNKK